MSEIPGKRLTAATRRFNRSPKLVDWMRRTRERALGDDDFVDHLSTARGRPADLAAQQLVSLRGERPGFAGEIGLTALQAWQRLGDGLMAAFWDASSAVAAAFEASERLAAIEVEGYRPRLRTGIHLGRPRKLGGDYIGVDVNIAARLAEAAKPEEILVSGNALAQLPDDAAEAKKRRFRAKGAPKEVDAYAVRRSTSSSSSA